MASEFSMPISGSLLEPMPPFGMGKRRGPYAKKIKNPPDGEAWPLVAHYRRAKGWTVDDLAARADISTGMVTGMEDYTVAASLEMLRKVADAFGITVGQLFDVNPLTQTGIPWARLRSATKQQRAEIEAFILGKLGQ